MAGRQNQLPRPPGDDRPNDQWVCGHAAHGCACASGPSPHGECQGALGGCQPIKDGNRVRCGRPACLGGPCDSGPTLEGVCGLVTTACKPRRTTAAQWSRAMRASIALSVISLVGLCFWPRGTEFFAAGPLSHSHRQILGSALANDRCAACHPGAKNSVSSWFNSANVPAHEGVTQTDLCMNCHHTLMPRNTARSPHGLPAEQLISITERINESPTNQRPWMIPRQAIDDLACASCHREHHGDNSSFTNLKDAQCQTCHAQAFTSFTRGHPEWKQWPYGHGGQIHFDHRTHAQKHFGTKQTQWDCRVCHELNSRGELSRAVSFEQGCAHCHDASMREQSAEGFTLLQFPSIDLDRLKQSGVASEAIPIWPDAAQGFDELKLPPLMRLMMTEQHAILASSSKSAKLDGPQTITLMNEVVDLAGIMANQGQPAIIAKLEARGIKTSQAQAISATFPAQLLLAAPWQLPQQVAKSSNIRQMQFSDDLIPITLDSNDPLLAPTENPLQDDPLASTPLKPSASKFDLEKQLSGGGWLRNDETLTLRYRPTGHADQRLQALVEMVLSLDLKSNEQSASIRDELHQSGAVQSCLKCHAPSQHGDTWSWRVISSDQKPRGFTKFSHRPHMHQPELKDCQHCHHINPAPLRESELTSNIHEHEFSALTKAACVSCHTRSAAGERCVQCHRYHVDSIAASSQSDRLGLR